MIRDVVVGKDCAALCIGIGRGFGLGERVAIQTGNATVEGTFDTIDEAGCLIIRTAEGRRVPVTAGEVYFGNAASAGAA